MEYQIVRVNRVQGQRGECLDSIMQEVKKEQKKGWEPVGNPFPYDEGRLMLMCWVMSREKKGGKKK